MESGNGETEKKNERKGGSSGSDSVSRWSPTKEQIAMLENLYKQGIRTPNTEQIQEITTRLRAYGNIQGKNVFYWFQNHKARQRQKLKHHNQQTISYSNRFLHASHPISPNVVYSPYCFQESGFSFYPQQPKVFERVGSFGMPRMCDGMQSERHDHSYSSSNREALVLFPLHPTGILKEKTSNKVSSSLVSSVSVDVTNTSFGSPAVDEDGHPGNQPFFNFFTTEERRY